MRTLTRTWPQDVVSVPPCCPNQEFFFFLSGTHSCSHLTKGVRGQRAARNGNAGDVFCDSTSCAAQSKEPSMTPPQIKVQFSSRLHNVLIKMFSRIQTALQSQPRSASPWSKHAHKPQWEQFLRSRLSQVNFYLPGEAFTFCNFYYFNYLSIRLQWIIHTLKQPLKNVCIGFCLIKTKNMFNLQSCQTEKSLIFEKL